MDNQQQPATISSDSSDAGTSTPNNAASYVDDYQPPSNQSDSAGDSPPSSNPPMTTDSTDGFDKDQTVVDPIMPTTPLNTPTAASTPPTMSPLPTSVSDQTKHRPGPLPPKPMTTPKPTSPGIAATNSKAGGDQMSQPPTSPTRNNTSVISQSLESQNIFFLLGAMDSSEQEKESFLDELQNVIWEDFLENDVELLITEEEQTELKKIMGATGKDDLAMQEEVVTFLEKLVPDLEDIMLEKALELKEDMVRERIAGMKQYFADDASALKTLDQAEAFANDNHWRSAAEAMNSLRYTKRQQAATSPT